MAPPAAIRPAAEKLSGATSATAAPSTVKPATATCHVGASTTSASAANATTAPTRSSTVTPNRVTSAPPVSRTTMDVTRYGNVASATRLPGASNARAR
ncbi:hypothetical protein [Promicromonospora sp. NPDC050880]|uniref:hypothetical protein n=1 Tax=Promicromonospora sp. NPDC050880 TaxID=3364406 RepID=UPI0037AF17EB